MKKPISVIVAFAIAILFFIQLAGTLVESIYILDLMNLELDEKALGVLFFFAPVAFLPLFKKYLRQLSWIMAVALLVIRGTLPYLPTSGRLVAAGVGTVAVLILLLVLLSNRPAGVSASRLGMWGAAGLGLAVVLSVFLRTVGYGLEFSLIPAGGWLGWVLGLVLLAGMASLEWTASTPVPAAKSPARVTGPLIGFFLLLDLVWFSFSAPAVIARWTEGNYTLIVGLVSLLAAAAGWICLARPQWLARVGPGLLLVWNVLFTLSLTGTLLAQQVAFPPAPDSAPEVVTGPGLPVQLALLLTLILFPVLFLDLRLFITRISQAAPPARDLLPGFLLAMLFTTVLIFINIFSNVWGYVPPVSPYFRGTFWLAFFLMSAAITFLAWMAGGSMPETEPLTETSLQWGWGLLLGAFFLGTLFRALPAERVQADSADRTSLVVMTYNIHQAIDDSAEKSFERQLALLRQVSPDIISMQETDTTRISANNNDYVRYYAERLGYHSYFGPTTVSGTYGTAILSKYPLENPHSIFTFSDTDEIGTTGAEIEVGGRRFHIYDVHPAGSDAAMLAFARTLLARSQDQQYVIALGDYNLRDYEEAYQLIDNVYTNAWTSVYPSEIGPDGADMSGDNRIDHIFVSRALQARNPVYLLPPDSATDHPVHWAEIFWANP